MVSHVMSLFAALPLSCNTGRDANTRGRSPSPTLQGPDVGGKGQRLTEVVDLDRGDLADVPLDEEVEVREDDEGRRQRGPRVVLDDEVVALELPVNVAVGLHLGEGVTTKKKKMKSYVVRLGRGARQV